MEQLNRGSITRVLSGGGDLSSLMADNIIKYTNNYFESAPSSYIPGPWLIQVRIIISESNIIECFVCIPGASDKNQRGLAIFDSVSDYSTRGSTPMPKLLAVTFIGGSKQQLHLCKTNVICYVYYYGNY